MFDQSQAKLNMEGFHRRLQSDVVVPWTTLPMELMVAGHFVMFSHNTEMVRSLTLKV